MTLSSPDVMEQLTAYRPTGEFLEDEWPAQRRAVVLDRIRSTPVTLDRSDLLVTRRRRHRWPLAAAVACVAALGLLVGGVVAHSGGDRRPANNAAGALEQLATAARSTPVLRHGQYMYVVSRQTAFAGQPTQRSERWTAADGSAWQRLSTNGSVNTVEIVGVGESGSLLQPTASFLAQLPTNPTRLEHYLRTHVDRSHHAGEQDLTIDQLVFNAVAGMLADGLAPPPLAAAAVRVLEHVRGVTATTGHDSLGRSAVTVTLGYRPICCSYVQSILFDPGNSSILEESSPTTGYHVVYLTRTIVKTLPKNWSVMR